MRVLLVDKKDGKQNKPEIFIKHGSALSTSNWPPLVSPTAALWSCS